MFPEIYQKDVEKKIDIFSMLSILNISVKSFLTLSDKYLIYLKNMYYVLILNNIIFNKIKFLSRFMFYEHFDLKKKINKFWS